MIRNPKTKHDFYEALPESTLKEIKSANGKHLVTIQSLQNDECKTYEVSFCAILIGSRPDLSLLQNLNASSPARSQIKCSNENLSENFVMRTLKRFKIFCEKCRHLNLCLGFKNRNIINTLKDETSAKPNLLQKNCQCELSDKRLKSDDKGLGFGDDPEKPIDCKNNPLAVNKFTNELLQVPGVYSLGPLVGDNFVRFIAGGALSIAATLLNET